MPQSTGRPWSSPQPAKGAATQIAELKDLIVGYAKQETVDPLKTLGRYLGFGLAGSLILGGGLCLLLLALLRGLQQVPDLQDPTWSWVPYLATGIAGLLLIALFMWRLVKFINSMSAAAPTAPSAGGPR